LTTANTMRLITQMNVKGAMALLALAGLSVFFGLLVVSGNPMIIGLGAGAVVGPALLFMPELTVWVVLVIGLVSGALLDGPEASRISWIVSVLSMLLLVPGVFNIFWSKQRKLPGFMVVAMLFLVYGIVISLIQWHALLEFVAGFKRCFQGFGLMMALVMIAFTPESYIRWRKFLMIVALLQFPFALYELVVLVPLRGGLETSSEATDVVAGTFGANLKGGSPNSVMVIYLFIALSFLVTRWRAGLIKKWVFYPLTFICLLPLGMGETKIAVFMLPLVGLILLRDDLTRAPLRFLLAIITLALMTAFLCYLYVVVIMHSSLDEVIDSTMNYNVGSQGYSPTQYLNRVSSITFWAEEEGFHDPLGLLIGNGLGSSYTTQDVSNLSSGHLGLKYQHYGINLTAASTLLWDTGLIGFTLFVSIFIAAWNAAGRLRRMVDDPAVKADALVIQAAISLFLLSLVYADPIVNLISMELIYALVLGYLGYLMNCHGLVGRHSTTGLSSKPHA